MNAFLLFGLGLVCAAVGGELFVRGLIGVARQSGVPAGIIGSTLAAFATSAPELSVAINSAVAGTPELALGDVIGSNIFNGLFIVPVAATIHPIPAIFSEAAVGLGFGAAVTVLAYPGPKGIMTRRRGATLILLWVAYILVQLQARSAT